MTYATVECSCCHWKGRTHRYPGHLLAHHLPQIQRIRSFVDHCVYFGMGDFDCYVCLTCKKGTTHTGIGRVGDRWTELHSRQLDCKAAHPAAYEQFKAQWSAIRESVVAAEKEAAAAALARAEATVAEKSAGGIGDFWEKCKDNRRLVEYLLSIEEKMKEEHEMFEEDDEDQEPYVFDPTEAFLRAIAEAMSARKEVIHTKQQLADMTVAHDTEISVHRNEIVQLRKRSTGLEETVFDQAGKLSEQSAKISMLETEGTNLKETVTEQGQLLSEQETRLTALQKEVEFLRTQLASDVSTPPQIVAPVCG